MNGELIVRGRRITPDDLCQIRNVIQEHWHLGRMFISKELCRRWDWRQANGFFKDQVCRILLRKLEDKGLIVLPPSKTGRANTPARRYFIVPDPPPDVCTDPVEGTLGQFPLVDLRMIRRTQEEPLWNYLIYKYHYKSFRIIVGAHLKYMAYLDDRPIACLAWSSSVFRIQERDLFIGWDTQSRSRNIGHLANNSRFLILPWVRIKFLASHLLSRSARVLSQDWTEFYGRPLYALETFVDRARFSGICYKAANWVRVGETKGYAKEKNLFSYHGHVKDVYVYPLAPDFRNRLAAAESRGGTP